MSTIPWSNVTPSATRAILTDFDGRLPAGSIENTYPLASMNQMRLPVGTTNLAKGAERSVCEPVDGSILVIPPASEKLIHHRAPLPYAKPIGVTPVVVTADAAFELGSISNTCESRQPTNMTPAPGATASQPVGTAILAETWSLDGSIRSTALGCTVQIDPDPTARFCEPTALALPEKTLPMRETTLPCGEICHSELPLRAHNEPKPATRFDGLGTSIAVGPADGVGAAVEVGETDTDVGGEVAAGDGTLVVPAAEHAVSRTKMEQRYVATRMLRSFSPVSADEPRVLVQTDHVVRPAYPWTPTLHVFLEHLTANGFDGVPRPIAIAEGMETLTFIPGESGVAGWAKIVPEEGLRAFARFLRRYHDATAGFVPPSPRAPWAFRSGAAAPGEVICHGDFGTWNVVWRRDQPVGLLDFDFAGPGDALLDVAYALQYAAPFCDDEEAVRWHAYPEPPDRRHRIEVFADAYGLSTTEGLVDAVIERQELDVHHVRSLAARGYEPQRTWARRGTLDDLRARVRWSREHRSLFE